LREKDNLKRNVDVDMSRSPNARLSVGTQNSISYSSRKETRKRNANELRGINEKVAGMKSWITVGF